MLLNRDNVILYAAKHYDNHNTNDIADFYSDLKRTKYIKTLFRRYQLNDDLQERLILNHIIIFCNVFGVEGGTNILLLKIDECYYPVLKTFLMFLNYIPETLNIDVPLDPVVATKLREI